MVLKSYAKVNLNLIVNKKLSNGLHNLQSIYCLVDIFDEIFLKKNKNQSIDKISFRGQFSKNIKNSDNSVLKVLKVLRKNKIISNTYTIKIKKKIPVFSGLGGGSSNAATILKFLSNKKINKNKFNQIINSVGSDLRLFFYNQGYLKNLNKAVKLRKKNSLNLLIIYPKIKCSTEKVYSMVKNYSKKELFSQKNTTTKVRLINYLLHSRNDLQSIVEKKHPIIKKLIFNLRKMKGCYLSRMTGSGSACYGLFNDKKCSKAALKKLRKKYPKFWFSMAKTI